MPKLFFKNQFSFINRLTRKIQYLSLLWLDLLCNWLYHCIMDPFLLDILLDSRDRKLKQKTPDVESVRSIITTGLSKTTTSDEVAPDHSKVSFTTISWNLKEQHKKCISVRPHNCDLCKRTWFEEVTSYMLQFWSHSI